jgi:hypothetical protein
MRDAAAERLAWRTLQNAFIAVANDAGRELRRQPFGAVCSARGWSAPGSPVAPRCYAHECRETTTGPSACRSAAYYGWR